MQMPPNYGAAYTRSFGRMYVDLAESRGATLIPFFLEGVGGHPELNQGDGVHPTAKGYDVVAANVWTALKPMLK
jgi:acyl-CoA thioesterase-1